MIKRLLVGLAMLVTLVSTPIPVGAQSPLTQVAVCGNGIGNFFGFQPWYACLPKNANGDPQLTKLTDIFLIIFPVVDWIIKSAVLVAAGVMFFMLFQIATSRGNATKYGTAIAGIRDAVIGLIIAILSVAILNFIAGAFY